DVVPRRPRAGDRHPRRSPHRRLGGAAPRLGTHHPSLARNLARRLGARRGRRRGRPALGGGRSVSISVGAVRRPDGRRDLPRARAATIGLTFGGPPLLTLLVAVVWGVTVIADSAQFSTAITELSPPAYVGTALTTQTCVGFALTMISIWLVPPLVARAGWRWAFATLAIGPALGVLAMGRLRSTPEALKLAGGRR